MLTVGMVASYSVVGFWHATKYVTLSAKTLHVSILYIVPHK